MVEAFRLMVFFIPTKLTFQLSLSGPEDGLNALTSVTPLEPSEDCRRGGQRVNWVMTATAMASYPRMRSWRQPTFVGEDGFHSIAITEPVQPETSVPRVVITCTPAEISTETGC